MLSQEFYKVKDLVNEAFIFVAEETEDMEISLLEK